MCFTDNFAVSEVLINTIIPLTNNQQWHIYSNRYEKYDYTISFNSYAKVQNTPTYLCVLQKCFLSQKSSSVSLLVPIFFHILIHTYIWPYNYQGCTTNFHHWIIIFMKHMFRHMYLVVFNTYINSLVPSSQPYHNTSSVPTFLMWYIPTNYDSIPPVNYHSIFPSSFTLLEHDTTEMSVTKKSITELKIAKQ